MKFYNFLLLIKSKGKKGLMRDKMRIENVEREREREMVHATTLNQAIEESRVVGVVDENS